jgi:hypothetical protein
MTKKGEELANCQLKISLLKFAVIDQWFAVAHKGKPAGKIHLKS